MKKRLLFVRLSLLVAIALLAAGQPAAADPTPPTLSKNETLADTTANITDSLTALDLEVREGYFQTWGTDECLPTFELMGTCYFNNPSAPYILPAVPYWDDEFVDPATEGVFGPTRKGYGTTFRFDPHEAILIFGYLPPPARYFGLYTYTYTHKGKYETDNETYAFFSSVGAESVFFHEIPLNPKRIGFMNSLSDSINNVMIERQSGASWDQFRYLIITPDGHMERELRQVLDELGVDDSEIFTERIPENVRLGLQKNADDFLSPLRYLGPLDGGGPGTASDQWRHSPTLRVLRVRDTSPGYPKELFPAWKLESAEARTAIPEGDLSDDLSSLVYAVADAWQQPCDDLACAGRFRTFGDVQSPPLNVIGALCSGIGMDCAGDAWDASYGFCPGITFDAGEVWAVIGTLGTKTNNATYTSVGLNNFRLRLGVKSVDYTELEGSASAALYPGFQGNSENLDKLFVYYFARDCEDIELLTHGYCMKVETTPLALPVGDRAAFTERDYIKPGTQRGPDSAQLLPSRALKLKRP